MLKAADNVTKARTPVERDYAGNVVDAHAPEMPTRYAKQLVQIVRGGIAIGMRRERAMELALRCARDSIPPLRLEILIDLSHYPNAQPNEVRARINKPWTTVRRELEALTMLGIIELLRRQGEARSFRLVSKTKRTWLYSISDSFDEVTLLAMAGREPPNWAELYAAE